MGSFTFIKRVVLTTILYHLKRLNGYSTTSTRAIFGTGLARQKTYQWRDFGHFTRKTYGKWDIKNAPTNFLHHLCLCVAAVAALAGPTSGKPVESAVANSNAVKMMEGA